MCASQFDGTLTANLLVNGTTPLEWIELRLMQTEGKDGPRVFRKQTLYKRAAGADSETSYDLEKQVQCGTTRGGGRSGEMRGGTDG